MSKTEWYEGKEGRAEHLVYLNSEANGKKCPLGGRTKINDII